VTDLQPTPCAICGSPETQLGTATLELPHRSGRKFTFHGVPASICTECGAAGYAAWLVSDLFQTVDAAVNSGFRGNVLEYRVRAST
jgi:YgiT-type zinc finger domain-containing protein